jgi:hypothetical protein
MPRLYARGRSGGLVAGLSGRRSRRHERPGSRRTSRNTGVLEILVVRQRPPAAVRFRVTRPTAARWAGRYPELSPARMVDRSSRPKTSPLRTPQSVVRRVGWPHHYNHHRPHTALGNLPPITRCTNVPEQYT